MGIFKSLTERMEDAWLTANMVIHEPTSTGDGITDVAVSSTPKKRHENKEKVVPIKQNTNFGAPTLSGASFGAPKLADMVADCRRPIKVSNIVEISDNDKSIDNNKADNNIIAAAMYRHCYNILMHNRCDTQSANIIANTIASAIIADKDISTINIADILYYCEAIKAASAVTVTAMKLFESINYNNLLDELEKSLKADASIAEAVEKANGKMQKPFTMDFSQFIQNNDKIMPQMA